MKKKLKIYSSTYLRIGVIVMILIFDIISPGMWIYCIIVSEKDMLSIVVYTFFITITLGCGILIFFSNLMQWLEKIIITTDMIVIYPVFKKKKILDYKIYNKISYGYMTISGINEWFIVISNRSMSNYELKNLNKINESDDYIKIKYSRKRRIQLQEILPENMAYKLKNPPPGKK